MTDFEPGLQTCRGLRGHSRRRQACSASLRRSAGYRRLPCGARSRGPSPNSLVWLRLQPFPSGSGRRWASGQRRARWATRSVVHRVRRFDRRSNCPLVHRLASLTSFGYVQTGGDKSVLDARCARGPRALCSSAPKRRCAHLPPAALRATWRARTGRVKRDDSFRGQPSRFKSCLGSFSGWRIAGLATLLFRRISLGRGGVAVDVRLEERGTGARQVQPTRATDNNKRISSTHPKEYCWAAANTAASKPPISSSVGICRFMPKL